MSEKNQSSQKDPQSTPPVKKKKVSAYDEPFGFERTPFDVEAPAQSAPLPVKNTVKEREPTATEEPPYVKETAPEATKSAPVKKGPPASTPKKAPAKEKKLEKDTKVHASTASPKKSTATVTNKKEDPQKVSMDVPRSAKTVHQIIPFVLIGLSIFAGISLILNIFCNWRNELADPSQHWMGIVGYYICYGLFGLFGPAVFALPFLLLNLGIYWKRYIDHKLAIKKIIATVLFIMMLASVIHVFCLIPFEQEIRNISVPTLMDVGAKMTGGGIIGGKIGYLLYSLCNFTGSLIIEFLLLIASLFYFLGMTPQYVWSYLRNRKQLHSKRSPSYSEQSAEEAGNRAKIKAKIRRTTSGQIATEDEDFEDDAPLGAVRVIKAAPAKKTPADKMAPMPLPRLDPNDGEDVFVPDAVNKKMAEMEEEYTNANTVVLPKDYPNRTSAEKPIDPASNKDAAVEPIFPKTADNRQARRVPRSDRSFDLKNIFIDPDDHGSLAQRKHTPVPPEVPLRPVRTAAPHPQGNAPAAPAATSAAASAPAPKQRPAAPAASPAQRPAPAPAPVGATSAQKPQSVSSTLRPPVSATAAPKAEPAVKSAPQTTAQKPLPKAPVQEKAPVFQKVTPEKKDFGLTNEEFERIEAQQVTLPRAGAKKAEEPKTAPSPASKPEAKAPVKTAKPAKPAATKRYIFPPIAYLHPGEPLTEENQMELDSSRSALASTLRSFHVGIEDNIRYSHGPTVTRYEITPLAGVRVRTITNLSDDIALALRASGGIRIEAPIPGTNAVGIEVPNKTRSTIYLRELIESREFTSSKSKLSACLGAGIANEPLIFDIAKMPHLLIAGTTGSGKSVCINCIVMSLLYKATPDEVKLVMIDPKKVEFSIYKNIPHLMAPVVTTPKDAAGALQACVEEMERRFELFEQVGVRDLKGYSAKTADDPDMPKLPYIVIIIDELADLMMTARDEVETAICRIAQKARAAGMHLIIGTQRPSADVVTGLIKSNVPSRIAFAVKSQVDSRVILDHIGAEALTGRGDMLFVPIGSMRDTRVQGAFVDDKEVEKICEFIRATNGTAEYDEKFITKLKELAAQCGNKGKGSAEPVPMGEDGDKVADSKYADAVRIAIEEKRVSTSLLQRKLEIGYSRAAKLIDRMQSEGYVSPPDGSKPRAILITAEEYMAKFVDNPDGNEAES